MRFEQHCVIAADHPGLAGHFPGNPIVPGVVLLDEVLRAFAAWRPADRPVGIPQAKFLAPLRPERPFTIRFMESGSGGTRFDCLGDDGRLLARGRLTLAGD
ncbi:MAG: hydroxymyristoyl-ACP dehydratase [Candidatus Competibacteraceae bacterium]|nr:MAG: hydroxymyristoyl-ACP dehydratase [Candidatus Competibacteraceae bacterium]